MSRKPLLLVLAFVTAAVLALAACGGGDDSDAAGDDGTVTVTLDAQNDSGQSGTAELTPAGEGQTRVVLELSNAPDQPQPAHIHSGSCSELGEVVHPLTNLEGGTSETTVDAPLEELQGGGFAINAHESEENIETYVACGVIP